jgi:hypothetical protein
MDDPGKTHGPFRWYELMSTESARPPSASNYGTRLALNDVDMGREPSPRSSSNLEPRINRATTVDGTSFRSRASAFLLNDLEGAIEGM